MLKIIVKIVLYFFSPAFEFCGRVFGYLGSHQQGTPDQVGGFIYVRLEIEIKGEGIYYTLHILGCRVYICGEVAIYCKVEVKSMFLLTLEK